MSIFKKRFLTSLTVGATLLFSSCEKAQDALEERIPPELTLQEITYLDGNGTTEIDSKDTVIFSINVRNEGGTDTTGRYLYCDVDGEKYGFAQTGMLKALNTTTLTIKWPATAGKHTFFFSLEADKADTLGIIEGKTLPLTVAAAKLTVKKVIPVEEKVVEDALSDIIGVGDDGVATGETVTLTDMFEETDSLLADSTTMSDNEEVLLETVKILSDNDQTVAKDAAVTEVAFEDTTVSAFVLPLAKVTIDTIKDTTGTDPLTGEPIVQVSTKETESLDTTAFFINVSSEVEEVVSTEIVDDTTTTVTTTKKKVAVPLAIDIEEDSETGSMTNFKTIKVQNSFGGISISPAGTISMLPSLRSRSVDAKFWVVMADELDEAALAFATKLATATTKEDIFNAIVAFVNDFTSILIAYDLQSQVTNKKPVITVTPSKSSYRIPDGDDMLIITYDIFEATVTDDKEGAHITGSAIFNPGRSGDLLPKTHTFIAIDSDGAKSSYTVTSKYVQERIIDGNVHDQGEVN